MQSLNTLLYEVKKCEIMDLKKRFYKKNDLVENIYFVKSGEIKVSKYKKDAIPHRTGQEN